MIDNTLFAILFVSLFVISVLVDIVRCEKEKRDELKDKK